MNFVQKYKIHILTALTVLCFVGVYMLPPIAQDLNYHDFADKRGWMNIPNFGDVMGNFLFLVMGMIGIFKTFKIHGDKNTFSFYAWMIFFVGAFLTGLGSGYYHLSPDNHTLVWDRIPMTISFMSLFAIILAERVYPPLGKYILPLLLTIGVSSVWYWDYTEGQGAGDLRAYALVQFFPMVAMLFILTIFKATHDKTKYIFITLFWYIVAKVLEHFDDAIFDALNGAVSGHTLKHIAAAIGIWWMIKYMTEARDNY